MNGEFEPKTRQLLACLVGGAMGDSLGADVEFRPLADIRRRFPDGLRDLPPHQGVSGAITDDTQMTLFTAEGLLQGSAPDRDVVREVHAALLRWYRTQGETARIETDDAGLVTDRRLHVRRAPGATCLSALGASTALGQQAANHSKGCGTVMRVAPVALLVPRDDVRRIAIETSALTHGHPTGTLAAAAWAEMLRQVADGRGLERAAGTTADVYRDLPDGRETAEAIDAALDARRDGRAETVEELGGGWVAEEALSIALYACLAANDVEQALRIAVTHGGDSDSTGAITGNMLGVLHPDAVLGHRWAGDIECRDLIERLVERSGQTAT